MNRQSQGIDASRFGGARRARRIGLVAALAAFTVTSFAMVGEASAAVQSFHISPSSGPIGTVVSASGTNCNPTASLPTSGDYVSVSSTTFPLTVNMPVAANGSWHGAFTIPGNALPVPGLVEAVCFTNGTPASTTVYTPQRFTVTSPATTTPTTRPGHTGGATGGTNSGGTTAANPGNGSATGNNGSGSGSGTPDVGAGNGSGGSHLGGTNGNGSGAVLASAAKTAAARKSASADGTRRHTPPLPVVDRRPRVDRAARRRDRIVDQAPQHRAQATPTTPNLT